MTTPYRDPAEMIKETRAQVESKKFKFRFKDWHFIAVFCVVFVGCISGWVYYQSTSPNSSVNQGRREKEEIRIRENQYKQDRLTGSCSLFSQERITDVPARCVSYFNNQNVEPK